MSAGTTRRPRRPIVALTGPEHGGRAARTALRAALARRGADVHQVTVARGDYRATSPLVLAGGSHVHPSAYDRSPSWPAASYDRARDILELSCLARAKRADQRVLGICRGMQLAAVAAGGTLYQNVWKTRRVARPRQTLFARRRIRVDASSRLARILGKTSLRVNCLHNQAIEQLPEGLRASAWDEHGVIYAIEGPRFIGVQWHPEYLPRAEASAALFAWLVRGEPRVREGAVDDGPMRASKGTQEASLRPALRAAGSAPTLRPPQPSVRASDTVSVGRYPAPAPRSLSDHRPHRVPV